jgi:predicted NBD/HSP70 family sugar kinase
MTDGLGPHSAAQASRVSDRDLLVGVDIGGSKIAVLVVDAQLEIRGRLVVPTPVGSPDDAADHIAATIAAALETAGASVEGVGAVGVGVPGRVDPLAGIVSLAVNLGWHRLPLREQLERRLHVPCAIENDVRAAAAGIRERRLLGDVEDFVYLSVGTGISAGVVLGGQVYRGTRGLAGEVGHIVVDAEGPACSCGLRGCLEMLASGPAIARLADDAIRAGRQSSLATHRTITAIDVHAAATAGDALATEIVANAGRALARAIHGLVMTYDVERVIVGGGVAGAGRPFLASIETALDASRASSELAAEMLGSGIVELLPDGSDTGAWGAITVARSIDGSVEGQRRWSHAMP